MDVFEELVRLRGQGRKCALATIVDVRGSIPSYSTAKLLVRDDGSMAGTIGGGCVEADVWTAAREVMDTEKPKRLTFNLGQDAAYDNGLICGGQLDVFVEPVLPVPHAFIFGAGHISKSLSKVATLAGFASVVIDNRDTFANRERFPEAAEVHAAEYEEVFPKLAINETSYIVIVTRGHRDDMRVLQLAIATPARYIAMIGSKRKVLNVIRELEKAGIARTVFERIHAPMGLDIGAISPEEIAISVTAEMIAVRRNAPSNWRSLSMSVFAGEGERAVLSKGASLPSFSPPGSRAAWASPKPCCSTATTPFSIPWSASSPPAASPSSWCSARTPAASARAPGGRPHSSPTRTTSAARPAPCSAACAPCRPAPKAFSFPWWIPPPSPRPRSMRCWPVPARRSAYLAPCCAYRATRAAAGIPSGFPANSSRSFWTCRRTAPPAISCAVTRRGPNSWTWTTRASWRISTMPPLTAASPEPPYETPPRAALQGFRRFAAAARHRRFRGAGVHRRPVWPSPADFPGARSRPPRGNRQSAFQPFQRPRVFGGQRHHLRRPRHRHGACGVYTGARRLHGGGAQHLVAAGRPVRHRLHPPRRSQHPSHQIGSGLGVGTLELFVDRQSLGDSLGPGHPRARQPDSLQVRRYQERFLPHRDRSRCLAVRFRRRLEDRRFRQARARRPSRARLGIVHPEGPLVRRAGAGGAGVGR